MTHSFEVHEAEKYGIPKAILLYNLRFWLTKNQANGKHIYEDFYWTYNSAAAFAKLFPYMNSGSIKNWLLELEFKDMAIKSGNFSSDKMNRTKWYTIPDEFQCVIEPLSAKPFTENPSTENPHCIAPTVQSSALSMPPIAPTVQCLYDTDINADSKPNVNSSSGENFSEMVFAEFRRQKPDLTQTALIDEVNLFAKKYNGRDVANLSSLVKSWVSKVDWSRYAEPPTPQDKPAPKTHMEFGMISEVTREMWPKKTNMECGNLAMMIARRYSGQKFDNPKQVLIDIYKSMQRPDYVDKVKMTYAAILNEVKFNTNAATEPWQRYVADKIHEKWGEHIVESFEELIQSFIYDAKHKKNVFATQ
jgi:hypothetical protein